MIVVPAWTLVVAKTPWPLPGDGLVSKSEGGMVLVWEEDVCCAVVYVVFVAVQS